MGTMCRAAIIGWLSCVNGAAAQAPATPAAPPRVASFEWDRDKGDMAKFFRPYRARKDRAVTPGPDAVEFRLGARPDPGFVGLELQNFDLSADFHIEFAYEIQDIPDRIDKGYGIGFGIKADAGGSHGGASVQRGVYHSPRYYVSRSVPREGRGMYYGGAQYPAKADRGRMALRRVGGEVILLGADGPSTPWVELHRYPFPAVPVPFAYLYGDTGGAAQELAVRVNNIRISTGTGVEPMAAAKGPAGRVITPFPPGADQPVTATPTPATPTPDAPAPAPTRLAWLVPVVAFALGALVAVGVIRWSLKRRGERAA